jgi:hypothetical protein
MRHKGRKPKPGDAPAQADPQIHHRDAETQRKIETILCALCFLCALKNFGFARPNNPE